MGHRILPFILSSLFSISASSEDKVFQLPLFTEGLYTRYSGNVIPDQALTEALNVLLDEDFPGIVVTRNGYAKYNATAITAARSVRGVWPFDAADGTRYFVANSSNNFFYTAGDGTWTEIKTNNTFLATYEFDCTQALGRLWCSNGADEFIWDGASTYTATGFPVASLVDNFRNRIVAAGISGNKSRVRLSGELDGTDWTTNTLSTSPVDIAVGGVNDGQEVTCLMGVYQDVLIIGKRDSIWGLYGFGYDDFSLRKLSAEVGCIDDKTVREKNNCLYWLSKRGIERFCGTSIERVSDQIRDQIDTIIATAGNARMATDSSRADFEAGNLSASGGGSPMSATISEGNVVPSTWGVTETSNADWGNGTLVNLSTTDIPGTLTLSSRTYRKDFDNGSYTTGQITWTVVNGSWYATGSGNFPGLFTGNGAGVFEIYATASISTGSYSFTHLFQNPVDAVCGGGAGGYCFKIGLSSCPTGAQYRVRLVDSVSSTKGVTISSYTDGREADLSNGSVSYNKNIQHNWVIVRSTYGSIHVFVDGIFIASATDTGITLDAQVFYLYDYTKAASLHYNYLDDFYFTQYYSSGIYTSRVFDTGFSTPTWGPFDADISSRGIASQSKITFEVQASSDSDDTFETLVSQSNAEKIAAKGTRYLRYKATFETEIPTMTPTFNSTSMSAATTGYFISQCRNPSTGITRWEPFQCNSILNDGSLSFWVTTGTYCHQVTRTTATWSAQTNNSVVSVGTGPYVAYRALFSLGSATNTVTLQDCTFNWIEGETRPPTASSVYRDRYYLSYSSSTSSGSANDHILVLDRNDKWTLFDNHTCYSLGIYDRKLYCGSATNNGFVYRMDIGKDDDGSAYTARIKTKAYNFGLPETRKVYRKLYLELDPISDPVMDIDLVGKYYLDRGTASFTLGTMNMNEDLSHIPSGIFPFPAGQSVNSRYLQLSLESTSVNQPWRLFGGRLYYRTLRKD